MVIRTAAASDCVDPDRAIPGGRPVGAAPALACTGGWHWVSYGDYLDRWIAARRSRSSVRDLRAGDGLAICAVLRIPSATLSIAGIFGRGQTRTNADLAPIMIHEGPRRKIGFMQKEDSFHGPLCAFVDSLA